MTNLFTQDLVLSEHLYCFDSSKYVSIFPNRSTKVPFFVRKRVKRRVEEEAARCGASEVTLDHVSACQRRFLNHMEDEVKGYQVETYFGPSGCPNRAIQYDEMVERLEESLSRRDLKTFLKERVKGPLRMHHEFRITLSDCPNACSRPQIVDVGLIGACKPKISEEICSQCEECVEVCKENAISLQNDMPEIDESKCLYCGLCILACPTETLRVGGRGYWVLVGGKLGRHPRLGEELPGIYEPKEAFETVERCLDHYRRHCLKGERFSEVLEKSSLIDLASK